MPEKRPLRLPAWVVMVMTLASAVVMVPTALVVYMRGGQTDTGTMQVLGLMLVPMLPFVVVSLWKGLDMPDESPAMFEDHSRELVVGERPRLPAKKLSTEWSALRAAGLGAFASGVSAYWGAPWTAFAFACIAVWAVVLAALRHTRRVNRDEED